MTKPTLSNLPFAARLLSRVNSTESTGRGALRAALGLKGYYEQAELPAVLKLVDNYSGGKQLRDGLFGHGLGFGKTKQNFLNDFDATMIFEINPGK